MTYPDEQRHHANNAARRAARKRLKYCACAGRCASGRVQDRDEEGPDTAGAGTKPYHQDDLQTFTTVTLH